MSVLIYTTPSCGYCRQAKDYLKSRKVAFTEKNVANDPRAAKEMVERSGQRGVPVLVIDGETIVGFDRPRIDRALSRGGSRVVQLGASIADAASMAEKRGLELRQGAYVGRVTAGSAAARAGLNAGDVILALGGTTIGNADDVQRVVQSVTSGQRVSVMVWRSGQRLQLEVTF